MSSARATISGFIRRKDTKFTPSGLAICELSIPVDKKWKDKATGEQREQTSWMNVVAMGKLAEIVDQYFDVGRGILVFGEIEIQEWEKDGQKRNKCVIKMSDFDFPPSAKSDDSAPQQRPAQQRPQASAPPPVDDFETDDIPF